MSDLSKIIKGNPRSNIAANFQNVSLTETLPPIGVFWDIENCQVPKGKSAIALVQNIRRRFFVGYREAEFMCVCDISKERKEIIQELNLAQVTVVHINATSKNAADDKLKQCMRRFVDIHGNPATIVLISGDVNFATDLSDFRHRHNIHILLVHGSHAPEPLLTCAHEHFSFSELTDYLPYRSPVKNQSNRCELTVSDLPTNRDPRQIQNRLRQLSDNCGGRVVAVTGNAATLRFPSADAAQRARKRMDNEDVFGSKISVTFTQRPACIEYRESSPQRVSHLASKNFRGSQQSNMSSGSSRESSPCPQRGFDISESNDEGSFSKFSRCAQHFDFPPPPDFISHDNHSDNRQTTLPVNQDEESCDAGNYYISENYDIPSDHDYGFCQSDEKQFERHRRTWSTSSGTPQFSDQSKSRESSPFVQLDKDVNSRKSRGIQKNIGRVSPFLMSEGSVKQVWASNSVSQGESHRGNISHDNNDGYTSHFLVGASKSPVFLNHSCKFAEYQSYSLPWSSSFSSDSTHLVGRASPVSLCTVSPVELLVTNLDQNFEVNEMKTILLSIFREHVMVLHISMLLQSDGNPKAIIKVPSLQDAQYAISQLHRRKIGYKRILISYASCEKSPPLHVLRSEVLALLNDIPSKSLPLFKFRELFEKRYHRSISVSELYKMREAVCVQEDSSGRTVYLNPEYRNTPSPADSDSSQEVLQVLEKPYCERHYHMLESRGWAEQESVYPLPNVNISLKTLAPRVHTLLDSHQGSLPLNSFCACYKAEFGPLPTAEIDRHQREYHNEKTVHCLQSSLSSNLSQDTSCNKKILYSCVPLEHLIACIPGVQITKSYLGIKKVQWLENKPVDLQGSRSISPALAGQLALFSREVVDLLKGQFHSSIPFGKFIPAYHHHFGRQCRVADYGFTKLIDLLEAIPHVVQILGQGHNRMLTLTHRSQVKRFAADFLRILKSQPSKQISLNELPAVYEQCIGKQFDITDYGVCEVGDMLTEISENSVVIVSTEDDTIIAIPKREQTPEEIERTKQFSAEVIELLQHTPNCSMPFSKFIPSYHHHFGRQCRVSDYGFSKLIELFEAIPEVLEVTGTGEDKLIHLTELEQYKILGERVVSVIRASPHHVVPLNQLCASYTQLHGHILRPEDFRVSTVHELLQKLENSVKVVEGPACTLLTLADHGFMHQISLKVQRILMEQLEGKLTLEDLCHRYHKRFGYSITLPTLLKELEDVIKIESNTVQLTPLQMLTRDLVILLHEHNGHMPIQNIEAAFLKRFGVPCHPAQYGFSSLFSLLQSQPDYVLIRGRRNKRMVSLNRENAGSPLPPLVAQATTPLSIGKSNNEINKDSNKKKHENVESAKKIISALQHKDEPSLLRMGNSPVDLLSQPLPSGLPSPELEPEQNLLSEKDLMGFESPLPTNQDVMVTLNEHEQQQLKTPPLSEQESLQSVKYSPCAENTSLLKALMMGCSGSFASIPSIAPQHYTMATQLKSASSCHVFPGFHQQPSIAYLVSNSPVLHSVSPFNSVAKSMEDSSENRPTETITPNLNSSQSSTIPFQEIFSLTTISKSEQISEDSSSRVTFPTPIEDILLSGVKENISQSSIAEESCTLSGSTSNISQEQKIRPDSISYEDLSSLGNMSLESATSTQSTPTRGSVRMRTRSRIAAQFSIPLE